MLTVILPIACGSNGKHAGTAERASDSAAPMTQTGPGAKGRRYALVSMGPRLPLPFEEPYYNLDCAQVVLGAEIVLDADRWSQRDSVQYRCRSHAEAQTSSSVLRDTVEVFGGPVRFSRDTVHFDVDKAGTQSEVEIGRISADTLKTGLGISGSTPRRYVRIRPDDR